MATTVILVRHAEHELQGRILAGRLPGIRLAATGRTQAAALARHLATTSPVFVEASPMERAMVTAAAIADAAGSTVRPAPALDEIDFGDWTGMRFDDLDPDPRWQRWNARRATAAIPGGETMRAVQERAVAHVSRLAADHPEATVIAVSHGDVIKAVLLDVLGLSLDRHDRIEVAPASISIIALAPWGGKVVGVNARIGP